jgi:replication factor A1
MSDDEGSLATGNILKIHNGDSSLSNVSHYLQVCHVYDPIKSTYGTKYKITVHDNQHKMDAVLGTSFNHLVTSQELIVGSVLDVTKHTVNGSQGKQIMIINEMEVLQKECHQLGNPTPCPIKKAGGSKPSGFGNRGGFGGNNNGFGNNKAASNFASTGGGEFQMVTQLSPFQKDFKIKVRVTRKGPIRTWDNARGSGKLFSVDFLDMQGGEIQATCFNDVADKFYPLFEEDKVYIIQKGRIKVANKRYTHITNDYQIDLNSDSQVTLVDDDASILNMKYDFKPLSSLETSEDKAYVDVCGVITNVQDAQTFTSKKTQKELTKRNFKIADSSGAAIDVTIWGEDATNFPGQQGQVCCLKAARVSEFNGKSLSANKLALDPAGVQEVETLKQWWSAEGASANFTSLTTSGGNSGGRDEPPITLQDMENQGLGTRDDPDYFNLKVCVMRFPIDKESGKFPWYKAVPDTEGPAYKVEPADDGVGWYCTKNGKNYNTYIPRYVLRMRVSDHTGSAWLNAFNDAAVNIIGKEAKELEGYVNNGDDKSFQSSFDERLYTPFNFRVRAKQESYNDENRRRLDVMSAKPIAIEDDAKQMLAALQSM